jgi:predicted MFS family arabinose efflux permease
MILARAIGPAVGGVLVAAAGAGWTFAFNALSYLGIVIVLLLWKRPAAAPVPAAERERFLTALYVARRYVRNAPGIRRVLLRTALFIPGAAAVWSLLPLVAGDSLGLSSGGYGLLLGAVGVGAVSGASLLPRIRESLGENYLIGSWAEHLAQHHTRLTTTDRRFEESARALLLPGIQPEVTHAFDAAAAGPSVHTG